MITAFPAIVSSAIDKDVLAFAVMAGIPNGPVMRYLNEFVRGMKAAGLWQKMKVVYPYVGGNAVAHSVNLVNPSTYSCTFVGGPSHTSLGIQLNGVNQYISSPYVPLIDGLRNDAHLSHCVIGASVTGTRIGCGTGGSNVFRVSNTPTVFNFSVNSFSSGIIEYVFPKVNFFAQASRTDNMNELVFFDLISFPRIAASVTPTPNNVFIGSTNINGSANGFSDGYTTYASLGYGLTAAEMQVHYYLVNTLQQKLGRI